MKYAARSPTRIDLAGGTLDCWPLFTLTGGAQTTNLAIGVFTSAELETRPDGNIQIDIEDLNYQKRFHDLAEIFDCADPELGLLRVQLRYWQPQGGFHLRTRSQSPVGGGLGGSSSLCISLIQVFSRMTGEDLDVLEQVELAHNLEAEVLHKPTGTQDYFPAIVSGLNVIHYEPSGPRLENLKCPVELFASHMLLVYTGQPHHSGLNNWQVIKAAIDGDPATLAALKDIKRVGDKMAEACRHARWQVLPELFQEEFAARIRLSPGFSSPRIVELEKLTLAAGAQSVKICGAGGGGCVLVWVPPGERQEVAKRCQQKGFQILDAVPVVG